jgi:hypothetical protein
MATLYSEKSTTYLFSSGWIRGLKVDDHCFSNTVESDVRPCVHNVRLDVEGGVGCVSLDAIQICKIFLQNGRYVPEHFQRYEAKTQELMEKGFPIYTGGLCPVAYSEAEIERLSVKPERSPFAEPKLALILEGKNRHKADYGSFPSDISVDQAMRCLTKLENKHDEEPFPLPTSVTLSFGSRVTLEYPTFRIYSWDESKDSNSIVWKVHRQDAEFQNFNDAVRSVFPKAF